MTLSRRRTGQVVLLGILVVAALPGVAAADDPEQEKKPVARSAESMQVFVDPATGRLRQPTPEEARQLAEQLRPWLRRDIEELEVVRHPSGMLSVDLKGRFQSVAFATVEPTGKLAFQCLDHPAALDSLFGASGGGTEADATAPTATPESVQGRPAPPAFEEK